MTKSEEAEEGYRYKSLNEMGKSTKSNLFDLNQVSMLWICYNKRIDIRRKEKEVYREDRKKKKKKKK